MRPRPVAIALLVVLLAVLVQTSALMRVRPFLVAPDLVLLAVLATIRHLAPEPAVLTGFSGGLVADLLGATPLGLRALVLTVVAFLAVRLRDRLEGSILATAGGVLLLTFVGETLFAVIGTLFGRALLSDALIMRKLLLVPVFNLVLAAAVLPAVSLLMESRRGRRWVS
ncbi:MAG: rod shape-determining protein MreD [Actinomycetota bacterium]|nr:rod shape-determining protein MreD [Actinomycetota bacterium]